MLKILQNEISRQEYMEMRYKATDEELYKQSDDKETNYTESEINAKYKDENFEDERMKLLEHLGLNEELEAIITSSKYQTEDEN